MKKDIGKQMERGLFPSGALWCPNDLARLWNRMLEIEGQMFCSAGQCGTVVSMSGSRARDPGFDTWSCHIPSFLLLLIQEGQLSVTGTSMQEVLVNL